MIKRGLVGVAWFITVGWGLNLLALGVSLPEWLITPTAVVTALFLAIDPLGVVWQVSPGSSIAAVTAPLATAVAIPDVQLRNAA